MPAGHAYPSGHLVPSHIMELVYDPIVETSFPELAVSFLDFSPSIPLGTSSILFLVFYYFNPEILYFAPISLGIIAYRFLRLFKTTPTDRVKSVRNRCVIEVLVAFLYCHVAFCIFLWLYGLLIGLESDFFLFLALFAQKTIFHQNMTMIFSAPEPKAQVHYCDYMLSVVRH